MNTTLVNLAASGLLVTGFAAQLNLMRIFIASWRESRRAEHRRSVPPKARRQSHRLRFAALPLVGAASAAAAQPVNTESPTSPTTSPTPAADLNASKNPFSLQINLDFTTAYFYRGIIQEDTGLIAQPALKVTANLIDEEHYKLDAIAGTWNSIQSQKTGATDRGDLAGIWYESDVYGGLALTSGPISFTTTYTFLTSPSSAYETVQELAFTLAYDDTELLHEFALHPYATLVFETGADASDGGGSDPGTYLEFGVAPGFTIGEGSATVSFPVTLGLSLSDYYQDASGRDDTFGYLQAGIRASIPLAMPSPGVWTLNAGVSGLFLGDHAAGYNAGDDAEVVATLGVQVNF